MPRDPHGVLVIGWNDRGLNLLNDLDHYLAAGAPIDVVCDESTARRLSAAGSARSYTRDVEFHGAPGGPLQWVCETDLDGPDTGLRDSRHVVLLADMTVPPAISDANVLIMQRALHPPRQPGHPATIVAEIRERPSRSLASRHDGHDLIVGHGVTALLLAQFARHPGKAPAVLELLCGDQVELDLVPPGDLELGGDPTFAEILGACWSRGLLALGYRESVPGAGPARPRLVLNPEGEKETRRVRISDVVVLRKSPAPPQ